MRSASVSMRSTGSPCDDGHDLLRHDAVVHGLRQVVVGRGRPGVQAEHQVHDEGLALLALLGEDAVVPAGLEAAQRDTIHANHSCNRRSTAGRAPRAVGTPASIESTCGHRQRSSRGGAPAEGRGFTGRFPGERGGSRAGSRPYPRATRTTSWSRAGCRPPAGHPCVVAASSSSSSDSARTGERVVGPELPAVGGAAEHVRGDDQLADERAELVAVLGGRAAAEDVLGAGDQGGVAGDGDVRRRSGRTGCTRCSP